MSCALSREASDRPPPPKSFHIPRRIVGYRIVSEAAERGLAINVQSLLSYGIVVQMARQWIHRELAESFRLTGAEMVVIARWARQFRHVPIDGYFWHGSYVYAFSHGTIYEAHRLQKNEVRRLQLFTGQYTPKEEVSLLHTLLQIVQCIRASSRRGLQSYRMQPHMPSWLRHTEAQILMLIAETETDLLSRASPWLATHRGRGWLEATAYFDRHVVDATTKALRSILPPAPEVVWKNVTSQLPAHVIDWWQKFCELPTPAQRKLFLGVTPTTARLLLEILLGDPDADWRKCPDICESGHILAVTWLPPSLLQLEVLR